MPRRPRKPKLRADPFAELGLWWLDLLAGSFDPANPVARGMWQRHCDDPCFAPDMYGTRPAAWWTYSSPEPRDPDVGELGQLARMGLLAQEHVKFLQKEMSEAIPLSEGNPHTHEWKIVEYGEPLDVLGLLSNTERQALREAQRELKGETELNDAERTAIKALGDAQEPDAAQGKDSAS